MRSERGRAGRWALGAWLLASCSGQPPPPAAGPAPAASSAAAPDPCGSSREALAAASSALGEGRTGRALRLLSEPPPSCPEQPAPRLALRALTLAQLAHFDEAREALSRLRALAQRSAQDEAAAAEAEAVLADLGPQRGTEAEARRLLAEAQAAPGCAGPRFDAAWRAFHPNPQALLGQASCAQLGGDEAQARRLWHRAASELEARLKQPPSLALLSGDGFGEKAAWAPEGGLLARTQGDDVLVVRTSTWREELRLGMGKGPVRRLDFLPRGVLVSVASGPRPVRVWSAQGGELLAEIEAHEGAMDEAFGPSRDGSLYFVPVLVTLPPARPDDEPGRAVALQLWDVATRKARAVVTPGSGEAENTVVRVVESPDGKLLVVQWSDGSIAVAQAASGAVIARLSASAGGSSHLEFSPDGRLLALQAPGQFSMLWDVGSRRVRAWLKAPGCEIGYGLAFNATGRLVATGTTNFTVCVWDAATGALRLRVPEKVTYRAREDEGLASPVSFFADDQGLVVGGLATLSMWDLKRRALVPFGDVAPRYVLQQTRERLLLADDVGALLEIDRELRSRTWRLETQGALALGATAVPGTDLLVTLNPGAIHDLRTGKKLRDLAGTDATLMLVGVDPTRRFVFSQGPVQAWELASGRALLQQARAEAPGALALDARQATVHVAYGGLVVSWRPQDPEPPAVREAGGRALALWASDGQLAAVLAGKELPDWRPLRPDRAAVGLCKGAPGGDGLAAVSEDGRTVAWAPRDKGLWLCPTDGSDAAQVKDLPRVERIEAQPAGRGFLARTQASTLVLVSAGGALQEVLPKERVQAAAVGRSGKLALARQGDNPLGIGDSSGDESVSFFPAPIKGDITALSLSPDTRQLVLGTWGGDLASASTEGASPGWLARLPSRIDRVVHAGPWVVARTADAAVALAASDGRELGRLVLGSDGSGAVLRPDSASPFGKGEPLAVRCSVGPWVLPREVCFDRLVVR